MVKFGNNNKSNEEEIDVFTATERQLAEQMKTWDFPRIFGYALGLLDSCSIHPDAMAKQVRIDAARKVLNIAWNNYLGRI